MTPREAVTTLYRDGSEGKSRKTLNPGAAASITPPRPAATLLAQPQAGCGSAVESPSIKSNGRYNDAYSQMPDLSSAASLNHGFVYPRFDWVTEGPIGKRD
ncbi:hypothetical protein Cni_G18722 [Canna indica]|uniref:Uncharacterized protein n=1 Tax=Canna indica TaxID=4628 RepID=A0AAQ3KMY7_9LILI|nr:hypothetical protein Cni_G18722 [Canna indica]